MFDLWALEAPADFHYLAVLFLTKALLVIVVQDVYT